MLDTLRFRATLWGAYVHLRFIGKRLVDFLLVLIERFHRAAWNADAV